MATKKNSQAWIEAKKRCRLNESDIKMAKELGMTPRSLIKNIPAPNQRWKAPVNEWIRDLYEKKFSRVITFMPVRSEKLNGKAKSQENRLVSESRDDEGDLPF